MITASHDLRKGEGGGGAHHQPPYSTRLLTHSIILAAVGVGAGVGALLGGVTGFPFGSLGMARNIEGDRKRMYSSSWLVGSVRTTRLVE